MAELAADEAGGGKQHNRARGGGARAVDPRQAGKQHIASATRDGCAVCPPVRIASRLASRQSGIASRQQLLAAGISRHVIDHWLRTGFLHPLHRGVYAVGHRALGTLGQEVAALLACGKRACLSHRSAAYVWGLVQERPPVVVVSVSGGRCRGPKGVELHRNRRGEADLRRRNNLRLTSPAMSIIDLAEGTPVGELERLISEARVKRLIRPGELERALERVGPRPGVRKLRAVLKAEGEPGITRSAAERILRRLLQQAGLPQPQTNVKIGRYEVDFLWPEHKVAIELDSWEFHGHRRAFERDRRKGLALQAAGLHLIRLSAVQIRDECLLVIAQIARALDRATRKVAA